MSRADEDFVRHLAFLDKVNTVSKLTHFLIFMHRGPRHTSHAAPMPESIGPPVSCFSSHPLRSSTMFSLHSQWIRRTATYMQLSPRDITVSSRCLAIRACTGRRL